MSKKNRLGIFCIFSLVLAGGICAGIYYNASRYHKFSDNDVNETIIAEQVPTQTVSVSQYARNNMELPKFEKTIEYNSQINNLSALIAPSNTFYFSVDGSDSNSGKSTSKPKKNPVPYINAGNCNVLLKSGDKFYCKESIRVGSNVRISTYGDGRRAGISFLQHSNSAFELADVNNMIYKVKLNSNDTDAGWIAINGTENWKKKLDYSLVNDGEYWVDSTSGYLYIKSLDDISGLCVDYALAGNGLKIVNGENCVVENIEIIGAGYHGISSGGYSNVLIQKCYVHKIGGAIQSTSKAKYGNGIEIWPTDSHNIIVSENIVSDCFDAGLTVQIDKTQKADCTDVIFVNNFVERCNYGFESFQSSPDFAVKDTVIDNNIFTDIKDITGGYRLTMSDTNFTAFLCLWGCVNSEDDLLIKDNYGVATQKYAISFANKSVAKPYRFVDNKLISQNNDSIKNIQNYTGDNAQVIETYSTNEYKYYLNVCEKARGSYDFNSVF